MADVPTPTFTGVVNGGPLVEPLGGPTHPLAYLDRFPDEVYNKAEDSHLFRFLYMLLGPAGIGWLKKQYLDARLILLDHGIETFDIEKFYGDPFRFGRLLTETFDDDPEGLLTREQWDAIKAKDESYRSRALTFFNAARLGTSPEGMRLAARSGLGHDVAIIENYRYLFDQHSDMPVGYGYFGSTASLAEFIIVPRQEISQSEQQTIVFGTDVSGGSFTLVFNGQATTSYNYTPTSSLTANVTLPAGTISASTQGFPTAGSFTLGSQIVAYTGKTATTFTGCTGGTGSFVTNDVLTSTTTSFTSIPWDAPAAMVAAALRSLRNIGTNGCRVSGGPAPTSYIITFTGSLSNQDVPLLTVLSNLTGTDPSVSVTTTTGAVDATDEIVTISPRLQHNLQRSIDLLRPVGALPTISTGNGHRTQQRWNAAASSSGYSEVLRYVIGSPSVAWPTTDTVNWIETGVEKEAPRIQGDRQHHYTEFYDVSAIQAYIDDALTDPSYLTSTNLGAYNSTHVGRFSPEQRAVIPYFNQYDNDGLVFTADRALADYAETLTVTTQSDGTSIINGFYPISYAALQGVPEVIYKDEQFWSSRERTSGAEYLEVDLGSAQGINFIVFETTNKPVDIEISFDVLDLSPSRRFVPITEVAGYRLPTGTHYRPDDQNAWERLEFHFANGQGLIPFARFIRIKLARRDETSSIGAPFLFDQTRHIQNPWTVELRNLRIGRNVIS